MQHKLAVRDLPWGVVVKANETGLDSSPTLELLGRHSLSGYGWQQGIQTHGNRHSEVAQAEAATHARDYLDAVGNRNTTLFVYRQIQIALGLFDIPRAAAENPDNDRFWLHGRDANNQSVVCRDNRASWGTEDPYWNFTDAGAQDYWLNTVIEEVCDEHAGYTTVYFDEIDDNWCGYWIGGHGNCTSGYSNETQVAQTKATYALYRAMVQKLNECGIIPIMASFALLKASGDGGITAQNPCMLWEDDLVTALDGLQWARFYEQWPDMFHMHKAYVEIILRL